MQCKIIILFLLIMTSLIYVIFLNLLAPSIWTSPYFQLARLNHCHEPRGAVQEHLNSAIFSIARLNRCHEPLGAVQEHLDSAIFSIARLNSFMKRAERFKSIWTVPYFQLRGWTLYIILKRASDLFSTDF